MCEPQMGSEVWGGTLRGASVQPGMEKGRGAQFGNYGCCFEIQRAELGESMMVNPAKTTKKVTTGTP